MKKIFLLLFLAAICLTGCNSSSEDFEPIAQPSLDQVDDLKGETEEDPDEDPIPPNTGN